MHVVCRDVVGAVVMVVAVVDSAAATVDYF